MRIVILGGGSGIGRALAEQLLADGDEVIVASRSGRGPQGAVAHALDVTDEPAVAAFFAQLGEVDHLAYTAGESLTLGPLAQLSVQDAKRAFETRVWGIYAALRHARVRESIVLSSGTAGAKPQAGWAVAAAICRSVEGFTAALALELAPVRVNAVAPGIIRTELWDNLPEADREALYTGSAASLPVGRVGEAADAAAAYRYLIHNGYTTGTVLPVDGGALL